MVVALIAGDEFSHQNRCKSGAVLLSVGSPADCGGYWKMTIQWRTQLSGECRTGGVSRQDGSGLRKLKRRSAVATYEKKQKNIRKENKNFKQKYGMRFAVV